MRTKTSAIVDRISDIVGEAFERQSARVKALEARLATLESAAGIERKALVTARPNAAPRPGEIVSVGNLRFQCVGEGRWRAVA